jgi:hypothetical protein
MTFKASSVGAKAKHLVRPFILVYRQVQTMHTRHCAPPEDDTTGYNQYRVWTEKNGFAVAQSTKEGRVVLNHISHFLSFELSRQSIYWARSRDSLKSTFAPIDPFNCYYITLHTISKIIAFLTSYQNRTNVYDYTFIDSTSLKIDI